MRFYLIDRVEEIRYGEYIKGIKCISLSDDVFNEHFPGFPVFPGSLIIESMAQLAGTLFELTMKEGEGPLLRCALSMVNRIKFKKPVLPGDRMELTARVTGMREESGMAKVRVEVDGELCAEGELTFTFHEMDENQALNDNRDQLYQIFLQQTKVF